MADDRKKCIPNDAPRDVDLSRAINALLEDSCGAATDILDAFRRGYRIGLALAAAAATHHPQGETSGR